MRYRQPEEYHTNDYHWDWMEQTVYDEARERREEQYDSLMLTDDDHELNKKLNQPKPKPKPQRERRKND